MFSAELQAKIAIWREKTRAGQMTVEEYRQVVESIRGERKSAAVASEQSKRAKAKAAVPDAKALLGALGGLKKP